MTMESLVRWRLPVLAGGVMLACVGLLWPFASAITWAVILAYVTWPAYAIIRRPFGRFQGAAAWLGGVLQRQIDGISADPGGFATQVGAWAQAWSGRIASMAGGVGRSLGRLFLVTFTLFFLYRDGDSMVTRVSGVIRATYGSRLDDYARSAGSMTKAVLFGFLVTACVQGLIAGIGYAILGIHGSVLLGAITGILSFIPLLGTAVVWAGLAVNLLLTGHVAKGIILLLWGFLLVHPADNVLRPLLISGATHVPFILVMFGVVEEQRVNVLVDIVSPRKDWESLGEGYRLDAEIQVYRSDKAFVVPTGALYRAGQKWWVYLVTPDRRARRVPLTIGHRNEREAEVLAGLKPGDRVVVYLGDALRDNARVTVNP